jgi:hypothetical protein
MINPTHQFRFFLSFLICISTNLVINNSYAITGREVMELVDKHNQGHIGSSSVMEMTLIDAHNNQVQRVMKSINKEAPKNVDYGEKSITEFLRPLDVKGTKLLTWTMKKGANKQWLYLPNFKRIKKINSKNQSGSFMGSEFSYEDIAGQEIDKYQYKLLKENSDNWVVESIPINDSGYSKMITTISKKYSNPIKVEYFDRRGELLKTSTIEGHKSYSVKKKKIFFPGQVTMINHQNQKKSVIKWSDRKIGVEHSDSKFKSQKLK